MPQPFAPNNNTAAKFLFTGRSADLQAVFEYLLSGNSVALYGERRGGKTLTLEVAGLIINREIDKYEHELIDETLVNSLQGWKTDLTEFKAIFISLQGTRKESELLAKLIAQASHLEVLEIASLGGKHKNPVPKTVATLLDLIQARLNESAQKLVILMDEMEVLGEYSKEEGSALAETFANSAAYPNILYVHAGSYQWRERVYTPGSNFTHLEAKYLNRISEDEIVDVLLKPITVDDTKHAIASLTGGKPLYAQYLGKAAFENHALTSDALMNNDAFTSMREQIERNIFREPSLDEDSKRILAALAYHPGVTKKWLAENLKLNLTEVGNRVNKLSKFGTIKSLDAKQNRLSRLADAMSRQACKMIGRSHETSGREMYVIVGKFIESYGKQICDDPTRSEYGVAPKRISQRVFPIARWVTMVIMICVGISLFLYTHPNTNRKRFQIAHGTVALNLPNSLEDDEEGGLSVSVTNTSDKALESLRLKFDSDSILYDKSGLSSIPFVKIEPGDTANEEIKYHVLPSRHDLLESHLSISSQNSFSFSINRRTMALRKYAILLTSAFTLLGLLIPGKNWASALKIAMELITSRKTKDKTDG
jgi:DNA-binding Lrp family transcriptional regulator